MKNIEQDQRGIKNIGKKEEQQKQSKKKKKLSKKNQELGNEQKKIKKKWAIFVTYTTSCRKILGTRNLEREIVS